MGDGLLPVRCQELFCSFSALLLGCGVTLKKKKKKKSIYKDTRAIQGSNKELPQKTPIYRGTKNFITLQSMQSISVILTCLRDFAGPDPQGFKFFVLAFVLFGCIPFKHQISQLEIFFSHLSVKGLLDLLLTFMYFFQ
jgi:hypothetical protein